MTRNYSFKIDHVTIYKPWLSLYIVSVTFVFHLRKCFITYTFICFFLIYKSILWFKWFMVKPQTSDMRVTYKWHTSIYEWHTNDISVHTSEIRMTYEYIRLTYEWHTSIYEWHTNDIRVHTSDTRVTYE